MHLVEILKTVVLLRQLEAPYMQTRTSRVGTGHQDGSAEAAKLVLGGLGVADIAQGKNLKAINHHVANWNQVT